MESLNILEQVKKSNQPKTSTTEVDEFTGIASKNFDYEFEGTSKFYPYVKPKNIPKDFNIGVIVGASGSGKSTLLSEFGKEEVIDWENEKAVISHFDNPEDAVNKLSSVGLNSIPTWVRPYTVLSTGEKFRADLSRRIKDGAVIDEFTSVVDRTVAKATSNSISKYIKERDIRGVVVATCHYDILEWLEPDWVFDTNTGTLYDGVRLRRPKIELKIFGIEKDIWGMFKEHHYLSASFNKAAHSYGVVWNDELVGFSSVLTMPSGTIKGAWREHRTVVLPDYQGMGFGTKISNAVAQMYIDDGAKFYSRTTHPRLTHHRENSKLWIPTSKNNLKRNKSEFKNGYFNNHIIDTSRTCSSYQYMGFDYIKKPFTILFDFNEDMGYNEFEDKVDEVLKSKIDNNYLTFIGGQNKSSDLLSETYAKENGIRTEMDLTKSKIKRGIDKYCDFAIMVGENKELMMKCDELNIPYRVF